jgi:hypothetical protein
LATPSDGKYVDAIVKLIQRDIPVSKVEATGSTDPEDAAPEPSERRPRRERHRGEHKRETPKAEHVAKPEPVAKASKPTDHEPRKPAPERHTPRPARSTPAAGGHSPFGSDGPVPAFLLRPTGAR